MDLLGVALVVECPLVQPFKYLMITLTPETQSIISTRIMFALESPRIRQQHASITNMVRSLCIKVECICVRTHMVRAGAFGITVYHVPAHK